MLYNLQTEINFYKERNTLMRSRRLIYVTIMTASIAALMLGFAFQAQENPGKKVRKEAMQNFKQKTGNKWRVRWNDKTGTPFTFLGDKITKYSGSPEQIARSFLNEEKLMLGIDVPSRDMKLTKTNYSEKGGTRLTFTQNYKGVPVLGASYLVAVDNSSAIYFVSGDYYPDINIEVSPTLSPSDVVTIIRGEFGGDSVEITSKPDLTIWISGDESSSISYKLVYKSTVNTLSDEYSWEYFIDALNGDVVFVSNLSNDLNGTGDVYFTSPQHGGIVSKTLHRLNSNSPRTLDGENVIVYNNEPGAQEASSSTATFEYDSLNTHFDEVMAYYHADEFEAWLWATAGMPSSQLDIQVEIYVHHQSLYASTLNDFTDGILMRSQIRLADQGFFGEFSEGWGDPAREAAVIQHEYMHSVTGSYIVLSNQQPEPDALDEAYSDFFAIAHKNDKGTTSDDIGDYIKAEISPYYVRTLNNTDNYEDFDVVFGPQKNSLSYSGSLWDYKTDPNVTDADAIKDVLESLNNLDGNPSYLDALDALLAAAVTNGHSANLDDIEDAFIAHGIYHPVSVVISGPATREVDEEGTWTANADDGIAPYDYAWEYAISPFETYNSIGTNSSTLVFSNDETFVLEVTVTDDNDETDIDEHLVSIGGGRFKAGTVRLPMEFGLDQNYPNPFNPTTTISYQLPEASTVTLTVFNIAGQEVALLIDGQVNAGFHTIQWDASDMASGIYFYRIKAGNFTDMKRMVVIK